VTPRRGPGPFRRFVALGDSQTEGVGDDPHPDGVERGWADRLAALLAPVHPGLLYANLAVRGRRIADVREQQLVPALALAPDLVTLIAGANDIIRPRVDLDAGLAHLDEMHRALRAGGATVVTTTLPDLSSSVPAARLLRARVARFNAGVRAIAARRGSLVFDAEHTDLFDDPRLWSDDRLHFSPEGHRRFAAAVAGALGVPGGDQGPGDAAPAGHLDPVRRLHAELRWVRAFAVPWLGRRITGRSSGDGRHAKRPHLAPPGPAA
jgi:lysophospholipase L1-like esterase